MGRKLEDRPLPKNAPPLIHRINWLLKLVWGGSITWMAASLGMSHPALSRILAGQMPSGKMLEALAGRPDINVHWLLTGDGDALIGRGQGSTGALCPIADQLLPGDPKEHPELLSQMALPAASAFLVESPYWYPVKASDPIVNDANSRVASGDYLLIDTSARWTRRLKGFVGRIVVLRLPDNAKDMILGIVAEDEDYFEDPVQHAIDTFGVLGETLLFPNIKREDALAKPEKNTAKKKNVTQLYSDDVRGVVLQLARFL
jgi:hypothetical protein